MQKSMKNVRGLGQGGPGTQSGTRSDGWNDTWNGLGWFLLPLVLHLPSLRPIFRFAPHPLEVSLAYLVLAVGLSWFMLRPKRRGALLAALDKSWIFWAGLAVVTVVTMVVYPYADALKNVGRGSDGDDALIVGAQSLMQFGNPYYFTTYFGNPLSPGPGWIMLVAPLSLTGLYVLLTPLCVLLAAGAARLGGAGWGSINLFMGLLFSSVATWEMTTTGIDHIPIALAFFALVVLAHRTRSWPELAAITLLLGLLATSRVVFAYWPLLLGFTLVPARGWKTALAVGVGATVIAMGVHLWGWATSPVNYHPWHVVLKTEGYDATGGSHFALVTLGVCAAAGVAMLVNWWRWPAYVHVWVGVFVPLFCAGAGELLANGNVGYTTLASYTLLATPFLLAALLLGGKQKGQGKASG